MRPEVAGFAEASISGGGGSIHNDTSSKSNAAASGQLAAEHVTEVRSCR